MWAFSAVVRTDNPFHKSPGQSVSIRTELELNVHLIPSQQEDHRSEVLTWKCVPLFLGKAGTRRKQIPLLDWIQYLDILPVNQHLSLPTLPGHF